MDLLAVKNTMEQFVAAAQKFMTDVVFTNLPKIVLALFVLWIGWKLIKLLNKAINKMYERYTVDKSLQQFLNSLIDIGLKIMLILTVMGIAGIKTTTFVAMVGAAGLAIGMALQGTLQNFAGGVMILLLKPFKVGDYIEQDSYKGFVEKIQIFCTYIRTYDNDVVIVPNTDLATKTLSNQFTLPIHRVRIKVSIAYGETVSRAEEVLLRVADKHPLVLKEPKSPTVKVEELGESSVNLSLYVWCLPENFWPVTWDLNRQVYEAFNKEGVEIPFNQLDVHIKNDA